MSVLGLDIGGANLKLADGQGWAVSDPFALWKQPAGLPAVLGDLIAKAPSAPRALAVTMTGELADCYVTKAEGVLAILDAVVAASGGRTVLVYLTDGSLVPPETARKHPQLAAASNWHALARLAGMYAPDGNALLFDVGSTTTDLIPLVDGQPSARGRNDPERLASGELVYTGVVRSPLCALADRLPWRDRQCRVAQEFFATTLDVYLTLGDLPDSPEEVSPADGRAATRERARDRLARMVCADRDSFSHDDAVAMSETLAAEQAELIRGAWVDVVSRMSYPPSTVVISGAGEFLARRVLEVVHAPPIQILSLAERLGAAISRCATAHAIARLAYEVTGGTGRL